MPQADGRASLQVYASVRNETTSHIAVVIEPSCALGLKLFPNPTDAQFSSTAGFVACPGSAATLDLAPGDTMALARVLGADTLANFSAGKYGIDIRVSTSTGLISQFGGNVDLPLRTQP